MSLAEEMHRYLEECYARRDVARTSELAAKLGMSTVQLTRACRRSLTVAPCRYFRQQQVERARKLLLTTNLTVDEIAVLSGFGTRATFLRVFHHFEHSTPTGFRRAATQRVPLS